MGFKLLNLERALMVELQFCFTKPFSPHHLFDKCEKLRGKSRKFLLTIIIWNQMRNIRPDSKAHISWKIIFFCLILIFFKFSYVFMLKNTFWITRNISSTWYKIRGNSMHFWHMEKNIFYRQQGISQWCIEMSYPLRTPN